MLKQVLVALSIIGVVACSLEEKDMSVHVCEGETLRIECPEGELIQLYHANYGRTSLTKCNENGKESDVNCRTRKSFRVVDEKCNQQQKCSIVASASTFEFAQEPCPGTVKYLEATYQCKPRA